MTIKKDSLNLKKGNHFYILKDPLLILIFLAAFALRIYSLLSTSYIWDEINHMIPIAESISLHPGNLYLPIHDFHNPSLPSYFIRLGSLLAGENPIGFRLTSLIAGLLTIALAYFFTLDWFGLNAARWTAILIAFNEYHVFISSVAVELSFHLMFGMLVIFFFGRFLKTQIPIYLYLVGASIGLGFLCKYIIGFYFPAFLLFLLFSRYRYWLRRKELYIALLIFFFIISPDLYWNIRVIFSDNSEAVSFAAHSSRIGSLGLTFQPFIFYEHDLVRYVMNLLGRYFWDVAEEYPKMNFLFGAVLFGGTILTSIQLMKKYLQSFVSSISASIDENKPIFDDLKEKVIKSFKVQPSIENVDPVPISSFLVILFWLIFGFFALNEPSSNELNLDPAVWFWVDLTLLPAAILTGVYLSNVKGKLRFPVLIISGTAMFLATFNVLFKN